MASFNFFLKTAFLFFAQSIFASNTGSQFFTTYIECSKYLIRAEKYLVLDDSIENSIIISGPDKSLKEIIFNTNSQDFTMLNYNDSLNENDYDDEYDPFSKQYIYLIPKYNYFSSNNSWDNDSSWDQPRNRKRQRSND